MNYVRTGPARDAYNAFRNWTSGSQERSDNATDGTSGTRTFRVDGKLNAEEWVIAGDTFARNYPGWSWRDADPISKRNKVLSRHKFKNPDDVKKQYLVYTRAPCHHRAKRANDEEYEVTDHNIESGPGKVEAAEEKGVGEEDIWVMTDVRQGQKKQAPSDESIAKTGTINKDGAAKANDYAAPPKAAAIEEEEIVADMEDDEDDEEAIIRDEVGPSEVDRAARYYDIYMAYDNTYQTPWLFLSARDFNGNLLDPECMYEDIYADQGRTTVSLQNFPHIANSARMLEIHPCGHSTAMKELIEQANQSLKNRLRRAQGASGNGEPTQFLKGSEGIERSVQEDVGTDDAENGIKVQEYMELFSKIVVGLLPTIKFDYTRTVGR